MGEVRRWAVFSWEGNMAAKREEASRVERDRGSVYTTCFSWSTSITTAPLSVMGNMWRGSLFQYP